MSDIVLVVVPHDGGGARRYLIVEERDGTFFLPAGRVEPGESVEVAAVRETAEEAGIEVGLSGLLGSEQEPHRMRYCFVGHPVSSLTPKSFADHHSRGARWLTRAELGRMPLRHPEVLWWIDRFERSLVTAGGPGQPRMQR